MSNPIPSFALTLVSLALVAMEASAQRIEYPPEEFADRRGALCESVGGEGHILMFGKTVVPAGVRFRQDNDFFYLSGNEDLNAVLFLDAGEADRYAVVVAGVFHIHRWSRHE